MKRVLFLIMCIFVIFMSYMLSRALRLRRQELMYKSVLEYVSRNDVLDIMELNLFRDFLELTYFYSVYQEDDVFKYGISAFDISKQWIEGGDYEYDVNGEEVDDGIDYAKLWEKLQDEETFLIVIQETEYGFMNSYYIRSGEKIIGIDILRTDDLKTLIKKQIRFFIAFLAMMISFTGYAVREITKANILVC